MTRMDPPTVLTILAWTVTTEGFKVVRLLRKLPGVAFIRLFFLTDSPYFWKKLKGQNRQKGKQQKILDTFSNKNKIPTWRPHSMSESQS